MNLGRIARVGGATPAIAQSAQTRRTLVRTEALIARGARAAFLLPHDASGTPTGSAETHA